MESLQSDAPIQFHSKAQIVEEFRNMIISTWNNENKERWKTLNGETDIQMRDSFLKRAVTKETDNASFQAFVFSFDFCLYLRTIMWFFELWDGATHTLRGVVSKEIWASTTTGEHQANTKVTSLHFQLTNRLWGHDISGTLRGCRKASQGVEKTEGRFKS